MRVKELERVDVIGADERVAEARPCLWGRYVRYWQHKDLVDELMARLRRLETAQNSSDTVGSLPPSESRPNPVTLPRPTDEDIWRDALLVLLPSYPYDKAAVLADRVLAEYRYRWPW